MLLVNEIVEAFAVLNSGPPRRACTLSKSRNSMIIFSERAARDARHHPISVSALPVRCSEGQIPVTRTSRAKTPEIGLFAAASTPRRRRPNDEGSTN
jgi:hypothetical protein